MKFSLNFPNNSGPGHLEINSGEILFVLGANGAGKSSLMHLFYQANNHMVRRISAHRQNWFQSGSIDLSPNQKKGIEQSILSNDINLVSRWKDDYSAYRAGVALFDLVDAENTRARRIAHEAENGNDHAVKELIQVHGPIKAINELLQLSNIAISVAVKENNDIIAIRTGSQPYSIAELSDGERNALLVAANILTAPSNMLILIDEPERHLHRSIISPLLSHLFSKRPDLAFVVSTHEVNLPLDHPQSNSLLVRGCTYNGPSVASWDADLLSSTEELDEDLRINILGARRKVLFIEGTEKSLDKPLYSLVFPNVSVVPKSSCHDVEHAVLGIREASNFHWLHAWGIVDNDRRTEHDIITLKSKGVHAISVFSVESIYYHPEIQKRIANRLAAVNGSNAEEALQMAKEGAINALKGHSLRLCQRTVEKLVRDEMFKHLPRKSSLKEPALINVNIDVPRIVEIEQKRLEEAIAAGDLAFIIAQYPIRETPAIDIIVHRLGFVGRDQYVSAVRKLLADDSDTLEFVKSFFGTLPMEIASA